MAKENSTLQFGYTSLHKDAIVSKPIEPLMTISQVTKYMGICRKTFYNYDLLSKIPHVYVGKAQKIARFKLSDVDNYLRNNQ